MTDLGSSERRARGLHRWRARVPGQAALPARGSRAAPLPHRATRGCSERSTSVHPDPALPRGHVPCAVAARDVQQSLRGHPSIARRCGGCSGSRPRRSATSEVFRRDSWVLGPRAWRRFCRGPRARPRSKSPGVMRERLLRRPNASSCRNDDLDLRVRALRTRARRYFSIFLPSSQLGS